MCVFEISGTGNWSHQNQSDWNLLFPACRGEMQSPIELADPFKVDPEVLETQFTTQQFDIVDGAWTIVGKPQKDQPPSKIWWNGWKTLQQFHFHKPGEELIVGTRAEMSVHFVFESHDQEPKITVIAVGLKNSNTTEDRSEYDEFSDKFSELPTMLTLDIAAIIPKHRLMRFQGSLTTPPCTESVQWLVIDQHVRVSPHVITRYPYNNTARYTQARNGRPIFLSHSK